MALELYYTSSPRGLRPGTSGLCTVAMTRTMSAALAARLESLCGYRPPVEGTPIDAWPTALSHWIIDVGGVERHILASVRPVRPDHTMRSNTLAHFAVLHASELDAAGAAWMLAQPETSAASWSGEPRLLDAERAMPRGGPQGVRRCVTWHATAGDAGWAGVLANAAMLDPSRPTTIIYPAGARVLELVAEAMSLVPAAHRWRVTFTTYFTQPIAGLRCTWRFCLDGTSAATAARQGGGLVIDACAPQQCTRTGAFIDAARSGKEPALSAATDAIEHRTRAAHQVPSAAASAGAADAGREDVEADAGRRVPLRMPVGIDESAHQERHGGRTALAAAVVVSIVLLAVVAVLAVIMRSMGVQSAELEARLAQMQAKVSELEASGAGAAEVAAERDRLQGELVQTRERLKTLEDEKAARESGAGTPEPQLQAPPAAADQPVPKLQDAQQGGDQSGTPAESNGGPAAVAMPSGTFRRQRTTLKDAGASIGGVAPPDAIARVAPPSIGSFRDEVVAIAWPAATDCGATAVEVVPSSALLACGFKAVNGSTLGFDAGGKGIVEVARVDVGASGPTWRWLSGSVPKIKEPLAALRLSVPGDWDAILGQVTLRATCADSQQRTAFMPPLRTLTWNIRGNARSRLELTLPAALARSPTVSWGAGSVSIQDGLEGTVLERAGAGSVSASVAPKQDASPTVRIVLDWIPSDDEARARQCADQIAEEISEERSLNAMWVAASWLAMPERERQRATRPAPELVQQAQAQFVKWRADRVRDATTPAARKAFEDRPEADQFGEFVGWLHESKLAPMRVELGLLKKRCDELCARLRAAVDGSVATVHPDGESPPLAVLTLAFECKVPILPDFGRAPSGGVGK